MEEMANIAGAPAQAPASPTHEQATALVVGGFFDELARAGVQNVVVSPGSRSTALAMVAHASPLNVYVHADERGAAFFALGLAKATAQAVCVVCTSGTAAGNFMPAVLEAESSRVPLVVLTADRPARLQQLGAPQTCDQLHLYGTHVRGFWNMPEPAASNCTQLVGHARQVAREVLVAAAPGTLNAAPVHVNFPFEEPLKPDLATPGLFSAGRVEAPELPIVAEPALQRLETRQARMLAESIAAGKALFLCGEGTLTPGASRAQQAEEVERLATLARAFDAPLLADPLSNLRGLCPEAIANYDAFLSAESAATETPEFNLVVRFGRYPVSKALSTLLANTPHTHIVVDLAATRDFNSTTTTLVRTTPASFVAEMLAMVKGRSIGAAHAGLLCAWQKLDAQQAARKGQALEAALAQEAATSTTETSTADATDATNAATPASPTNAEGPFIHTLLQAIPRDGLLFCGNSMAVRAVDTFHTPSEVTFTLLGNRGLNGIDGTLSSAIGAAQAFPQTVALVGDITALHDINALAWQNEMLIREAQGHARPSITVVVLNNNGGAIFDMLPQQSEEPYFQRLFLTPQNVNFEAAAQAFSVPYYKASTPAELRATLRATLRTPGLNLVEVPLPLSGVRERYAQFK